MSRGVIDKTLAQVAEIGTVYTATWKATSSSATGVILTNALTVPKGKYIVVVDAPVLSAAGLVSIRLNGQHPNDAYHSIQSQDSFSEIVQTTGSTTIDLQTDSSAAITYSYINRGRIQAIRIA